MTAHLTARLSDGTVVEDQQLKFVTDEGAPSSAGCPNSVQNPRTCAGMQAVAAVEPRNRTLRAS